MFQATSSLFMVRPAHFAFNEQTAASNTFQNATVSITDIQAKAIAEFDAAVCTLREKGIEVWVIEDTDEVIKPDAVFPNNWISTHEDGTVVLYPMLTPNRRAERRMDVVTELENNFQVAKIIDLSNYEARHQFLEGTGSIVFDHTARVAYACLSPRTHLAVLLQLCNEIGYTAISFHAVNEHNVEVYHTNVIMGIGADFAVICLASIQDEKERNSVVQSLLQSGKEIIDVSFDQIKSFAGNVLAVNGKNDLSYLAMSQSAFESFTKEQLAQIGKYCQILPIPIPTIETIGGGSVRCMLAQNFLKKK